MRVVRKVLSAAAVGFELLAAASCSNDTTAPKPFDYGGSVWSFKVIQIHWDLVPWRALVGLYGTWTDPRAILMVSGYVSEVWEGRFRVGEADAYSTSDITITQVTGKISYRTEVPAECSPDAAGSFDAGSAAIFLDGSFTPPWLEDSDSGYVAIRWDYYRDDPVTEIPAVWPKTSAVCSGVDDDGTPWSVTIQVVADYFYTPPELHGLPARSGAWASTAGEGYWTWFARTMSDGYTGPPLDSQMTYEEIQCVSGCAPPPEEEDPCDETTVQAKCDEMVERTFAFCESLQDWEVVYNEAGQAEPDVACATDDCSGVIARNKGTDPWVGVNETYDASCGSQAGTRACSVECYGWGPSVNAVPQIRGGLLLPRLEPRRRPAARR